MLEFILNWILYGVKGLLFLALICFVLQAINMARKPKRR